MALSIPVTLLYGGLNALLAVLLGVNVSRTRLRLRVLAGQPQPPELTILVRAHGNAAEWIPLGIVLLLALEVSHATGSFALHLFGGLFFLARVLHAIGFYTRFKIGMPGAALNYLLIAAMSLTAIAHHFPR